MTDITLTEAWQHGAATAKEQIAEAVAKAAAETAAVVPVSPTWAATSILASPHIANWPADARKWLFDKAGITHLRDMPSRFCTVDGCGLTTDDTTCWAHRNGGGLL